MTQPAQEAIQEQNQVQTPKEDNLRKQREHYEKQIADRDRALKEAQDRLSQLSKQTPEDYDDEPYVDQKRLKQQLSRFEEDMEKKIDQKAEMKARMLLEEDKRNDYLKRKSDFNQIMSSDVVQKFAEAHPEVAETILRMPEGFERQKLVYETIKAMQFDKPKSKEPSVQDKIAANARSPYYQPSSMGSAPYQSQGDFSDTGMKNAYAQMKDKISKLGRR